MKILLGLLLLSGCASTTIKCSVDKNVDEYKTSRHCSVDIRRGGKVIDRREAVEVFELMRVADPTWPSMVEAPKQ